MVGSDLQVADKTWRLYQNAAGRVRVALPSNWRDRFSAGNVTTNRHEQNKQASCAARCVSVSGTAQAFVSAARDICVTHCRVEQQRIGNPSGNWFPQACHARRLCDQRESGNRKLIAAFALQKPAEGEDFPLLEMMHLRCVMPALRRGGHSGGTSNYGTLSARAWLLSLTAWRQCRRQYKRTARSWPHRKRPHETGPYFYTRHRGLASRDAETPIYDEPASLFDARTCQIESLTLFPKGEILRCLINQG